jgi:hypothetical protein
VEFGPVGIGEGRHQVFADFDDPVHDGLQGAVVVASTYPWVSRVDAEVHSVRAAVVRYVTRRIGGLLSTGSVVKSAANFPESVNENS